MKLVILFALVGWMPNDAAAFVCPSQSSSVALNMKPSRSVLLAKKDAERTEESLFDLSFEMTALSFLIYTYADLRELAAKNKLKTEDLLKLPISAREIVDICNRNQDTLEKEFSKDNMNDYLVVKRIVEDQERSGKEESKALLVAFDDKYASQSLVYGVGVDDAKKRVTVCFRGTHTLVDGLIDLQAWLEEMPNRMKKYDKKGQEDKVRVHNGFHTYLFDPLPKNEAEGLTEDDIELEGEALSKYDIIMQQYVLPQLRKNPGYELYVTGHSLGAAIATLFAFRAATSKYEAIQKIRPVTCVAVASPFVGARNYQSAYKLAEEMGFVRLLRISGWQDIINTLPFISISLKKLSFGLPFKHVGMNIQLTKPGPDTTYNITYPRRDNFFQRVFKTSLLTNVDNPFLLLNNHLDYSQRLASLADDEYLNMATISDVYKENMSND